MPRTRVRLDVCVELDPVPGTFNTADSARNCVSMILTNSIGHYHPEVSLVEVLGEPNLEDQPELDLFPVDFSKDN